MSYQQVNPPPAPNSYGGGNTAILANPNTQNGKTVQIAITYQGSDFYYAICAVMGFVALAIVAASATKPRTDRIFFYITAGVNMTACIAYFTMGSNLGWTPIDVEFLRTSPKVAGVNREIFYVRYIDWFITTPLLIMDILLTGGVPWPTIVWTIFLDWVMIICGLVGALVKSRYKWAYWTFGTVAMFYIFFNIGFDGRKHAKAMGKAPYRCYLICGVWTLFLWTLYPIAWGLCEGGNVISSDAEAIFYGVLDFCAKPIFSIMLIVGHWNIDPGSLGLKIRDVNEDPKLFQDGKLPPGEAMAYNNGNRQTDGLAGSTNGFSSGVDAHT